LKFAWMKRTCKITRQDAIPESCKLKPGITEDTVDVPLPSLDVLD
jgi:hypothetical protein